METNFITRRLQGILPVAGVAIVGVVAVTTAMTVLGGTEAAPSPIVIPSLPTVPTPSVSPGTTALGSPSDSPSPMITALLPSSPPIGVIGRKTIRDPNGVWFIDVHYPQLKVGSTPLAGVVNADVLDEVQSRIDVFEGGPAAIVQQPGKLNILTSAYRTDLLAPDLASYTVRWEDDTIPGSPNIYVRTLNYWLKTGQRVDLDSVFADLPGALAILSRLSQVQLHQLLGDRYSQAVVDDGTAPVSTNFSSWALTQAGFKVTFAEFQVGDATDGLPIVVIPWSALAPVMRPVGPVARLAGFAVPTPAPSGSGGLSPSGSAGLPPSPPAASPAPPAPSPTPAPTPA